MIDFNRVFRIGTFSSNNQEQIDSVSGFYFCEIDSEMELTPSKVTFPYQFSYFQLRNLKYRETNAVDACANKHLYIPSSVDDFLTIITPKQLSKVGVDSTLLKLTFFADWQWLVNDWSLMALVEQVVARLCSWYLTLMSVDTWFSHIYRLQKKKWHFLLERYSERMVEFSTWTSVRDIWRLFSFLKKLTKWIKLIKNLKNMCKADLNRLVLVHRSLGG